MPTDSQRRNLASAHRAEVQGLNERIALLEQQLAETQKDVGRPFPVIVHEAGQRLELWLMKKDDQGTLRPLGQTGPISLPSAWDFEYRAAITRTQEQA